MVDESDSRTPQGEADGTVEDVADRFGYICGLLVTVPLGILGRIAHAGTKGATTTLTTILPFVGGLHKRLAKWALYKYHKKAGGDAVGVTFEANGQADFVPVKYKEQSVDEDEGAERAGWHALDRDRSWHEGADGREVDYIGKTPVVMLDAASTQRATVTEARFAECLDLDRVADLYQVPDRGAVDVTVQVGAPGAATGNGRPGARADGGVQMDILEANVREAIWQDSVVDIGVDDHDGMRVNPRKVKETYREQTGAEQLDEVERLGFLAGKLESQVDTGFIIKVLLIALGIVAAATIGPDLLGTASGAASGGGGSILPLLVGW